MKGSSLIQASLLLVLATISCYPKKNEIYIEFPIRKKASELCEYYTWARFFHEGELINKDSTITNHFRIPDQADSVEVYANGYGFTLIDTSFKLPDRFVKLEVDPNSYPYFDAHSQVDRDVKNGKLIIYTEDYEFFLIDSIYGWLQKYGASAEYHSWEEPGRDQRFVYNCYSTKYLLEIDSNAFENDFQALDSLTYLEIDQFCNKPVEADDLPILLRLGKINDRVIPHIEGNLNQNYQGWYIEEIKEKDYSLDHILDSLLMSSNYHFVRLAEVYGYFYPAEMIDKCKHPVNYAPFFGVAGAIPSC